MAHWGHAASSNAEKKVGWGAEHSYQVPAKLQALLQSMGSQSQTRLKQLSTRTNLQHPQPLLGSPFIMILGPCE